MAVIEIILHLVRVLVHQGNPIVGAITLPRPPSHPFPLVYCPGASRCDNLTKSKTVIKSFLQLFVTRPFCQPAHVPSIGPVDI
jgi:hypothetical protein